MRKLGEFFNEFKAEKVENSNPKNNVVLKEVNEKAY